MSERGGKGEGNAGTSLVFVVYPEALSQMPLPWLWAIFFFLVVFFLGVSTQIG